MATTAIRTKTKEGQILNLLFMTVQQENGLHVDICRADDDFMVTGTPSLGVADNHISEEAYHRDLRKQANDRGEFIRDYSTNPEWNPDADTTDEPQSSGLI